MNESSNRPAPAHGRHYVKGCPCGYCEAYRARARERSRRIPDKDRPGRREYKTGKQRQYDQAKREQQPPKPPKPPRAPKAANAGRHGGPEEWARMHEAQSGLCYLCLRPLPQDRAAVHVDHDHSCCDPGPKGRDTRSCQYCRRGLVHERCNQIWGLAKEDAELLRTMADQGQRVRDATRQRIAGKPYVQAVLAVDAQGAIDEVKPEPMPDLDMPVGTPWPTASGTLF